jgi:hypothetical protein
MDSFNLIRKYNTKNNIMKCDCKNDELQYYQTQMKNTLHFQTQMKQLLDELIHENCKLNTKCNNLNKQITELMIFMLYLIFIGFCVLWRIIKNVQ